MYHTGLVIDDNVGPTLWDWPAQARLRFALGCIATAQACSGTISGTRSHWLFDFPSGQLYPTCLEVTALVPCPKLVFMTVEANGVFFEWCQHWRKCIIIFCRFRPPSPSAIGKAHLTVYYISPSCTSNRKLIGVGICSVTIPPLVKFLYSKLFCPRLSSELFIVCRRILQSRTRAPIRCSTETTHAQILLFGITGAVGKRYTYTVPIPYSCGPPFAVGLQET